MRFETKLKDADINSDNLVQMNLTEFNPKVDVETRIKETRNASRNSPIVKEISKKLDVSNQKDILNFGMEAAKEITKFCDDILSKVQNKDLEETNFELNKLDKILSKVSFEELEAIQNDSDVKNVFKKIFNKVENLIEKYNTIGSELSKVEQSIATRESTLITGLSQLENLYTLLFGYFESLENYIVAGELVVEELTLEDLPYFEERSKSGGQKEVLELDNVKNTISRLNTSIANLEKAKGVALLTAIQIKTLEKTISMIIQDIHDVFIVVMPNFKIGLTNAVHARSAKQASKAINAVQERGRMMQQLNSKNIANTYIDVANNRKESFEKDIESLKRDFNIMIEGINRGNSIILETTEKQKEGVKEIYKLQEELSANI